MGEVDEADLFEVEEQRDAQENDELARGGAAVGEDKDHPSQANKGPEIAEKGGILLSGFVIGVICIKTSIVIIVIVIIIIDLIENVIIMQMLIIVLIIVIIIIIIIIIIIVIIIIDRIIKIVIIVIEIINMIICFN